MEGFEKAMSVIQAEIKRRASNEPSLSDLSMQELCLIQEAIVSLQLTGDTYERFLRDDKMVSDS